MKKRRIKNYSSRKAYLKSMAFIHINRIRHITGKPVKIRGKIYYPKKDRKSKRRKR